MSVVSYKKVGLRMIGIGCLFYKSKSLMIIAVDGQDARPTF